MALYTLTVRDRFEAAHFLRSYQGAPETVHGHSWQVIATLETDRLDEEGMGFDFVEVRRHLRALAERFHHNDINSVPPFDVQSPTTEHLARWFYDELSGALTRSGLAAITVWEGPDCSATYRP
ncbi:MAG: 6-carboxytetrahydropterin synthase [Acidobacteriota bacterium]